MPPRIFRYNAQTAQYEERPLTPSGKAPLASRTGFDGRSGGQTQVGGTAAGEDLTLQSTAHATRGLVKAVDPVQVTADMTTAVGTISAVASSGTNQGAGLHLQGRTSGGAAVDWTLVASKTGPLVARLGIGEGAGDGSDDRLRLGSDGQLLLKQITALDDPGAGWTAIGAKGDGSLYMRDGGGAETAIGGAGVTDHGALTGLSDDDHSQYALLAGRASGQTLVGGSAASEHLTLQSTAHATRGRIKAVDMLEAIGTTEQLRLSYDATHVTSFTVGATGALTITPQAGTNLNIALSTTGDFAVNSNQLYVDTSTGYTGFGTTLPSALLHAKPASAGAASAIIESNGNNDSGLMLKSGATTGDHYNIIALLNSSGSTAGQIVSIASHSTPTAAGSLVIDYNTTLGSAATLRFRKKPDSEADEVARFDASGNFGIGRTSPQARLDVNGTVLSQAGSLQVWKDTTPSKAIALGMAVPGNAITNDLYFSTYNGSAWRGRLTILNSNGNAGFGTATPNVELEVRRDQAGTTAIRVHNATSNAAAATTIQTLNNNSDVAGLGIYSTTTTPYGAVASGAAYIYTGSSAGLTLMSDAAGGVIKFASGGNTERARFDASGNFGVGITPTSRIHGSTTLSAATGDEIAYRLDYTVNKATSGNDTGLLISMTDTLSPGTSLPLNIQVGAATKFKVDNAGICTTEGTKRVACGGGSTGAGTTANGTVTLEINGVSYYLLTSASA